MAASKTRGFFRKSLTTYDISADDAYQLLEDVGSYHQRELLNEGLTSKTFILGTQWEGRLELYGNNLGHQYRLDFRETGDREPRLITRIIDVFAPEREPISSFTIEGELPPGYEVERELGLEAR